MPALAALRFGIKSEDTGSLHSTSYLAVRVRVTLGANLPAEASLHNGNSGTSIAILYTNDTDPYTGIQSMTTQG